MLTSIRSKAVLYTTLIAFITIKYMLLKDGELDRFAFYYRLKPGQPEILALYHMTQHKGLVMMENGKHYQKFKPGQKEVSPNDLFPETLQTLLERQRFELRDPANDFFTGELRWRKIYHQRVVPMICSLWMMTSGT